MYLTGMIDLQGRFEEEMVNFLVGSFRFKDEKDNEYEISS